MDLDQLRGAADAVRCHIVNTAGKPAGVFGAAGRVWGPPHYDAA